MSTVQKRQSSNRIFIWLALASVLAVFLALQIYRNVEQAQQLKRDLSQAQSEHDSLLVRKTELQAQVDMLNNDDYVLKLARSRGYFSLKNEIIFNIPEENNLLKQEKERAEADKNNGN